jgi:NAD+ synthase
MLAKDRAAEVCDEIAAFVRSSLEKTERSGIAVAMSGGLDSSVTAALCVRGVGADKVTGFSLPEREGPPKDVDDTEFMAQRLGIKLDTYDISSALGDMGVYDFVLSRLPGEALRAAIVRTAYGVRRMISDEDPLAGGLGGSKSAALSRASAHFKARHRMRMVYLFFRAERRNLLVAGAANKTEKLTGIYSRFGVDDCADIMPIAGLYRTEVLALANELEIPDRITSKPPSPGIIPGVKDKYVYLMGLPSDRLDEVLEAFESGASRPEIASRHGLDGEHVERIAAIMQEARDMKKIPLEPEIARLREKAGSKA